MTTIEQAKRLQNQRSYLHPDSEKEVRQLAGDFITLTRETEQLRELARTNASCGHGNNFQIVDEHGNFFCTVCQIELLRSQLLNCQRDLAEGNRQNALVLAAYNEEKARLDWLENQCILQGIIPQFWVSSDNKRFQYSLIDDDAQVDGKSIREAIDAARKAETR